MKKLRSTDCQIVNALNRAEAGIYMPVVSREPSMSVALSYRWLAKYRGIDAQ